MNTAKGLVELADVSQGKAADESSGRLSRLLPDHGISHCSDELRQSAAASDDASQVTLLKRRTTEFMAKRGCAALLIALLLVVGQGCSIGDRKTDEKAYLDPDPGNKRLSAMKRESALNLIPPGTKLQSKRVQSKRLGEVLSSDLGMGPSIIRRFTPRQSTLDFQAAYQWYDKELTARGWRRRPEQEQGNFISDHGIRIYRKTIDNWCAGLSLRENLEDSRPSGNLRFELSAPAGLFPEKNLPCRA